MSTAERERAIVAAADPSKASQSTPSTASNPSNVIGNSITDLRNIFTGLGDIAIHPLNNGLTDSVKNTFDLIDGDHKLTGTTGDKLGQLLTGTVLSFLPGAADVGTILKAGSLDAGLELLAEHPIGSLLDLSGAFQPVRLAGLAGEDEAAPWPTERASALQDAKHAGIISTGKGLILNTKTSKIGQTAAPGIGAMSIGDRLHAWTAGSMLNLNPDIADAAGGYEQTLNHYNNVKASKFTDWEEAKTHLDDSQKAQLEIDPVQSPEGWAGQGHAGSGRPAHHPSRRRVAGGSALGDRRGPERFRRPSEDHQSQNGPGERLLIAESSDRLRHTRRSDSG